MARGGSGTRCRPEAIGFSEALVPQFSDALCAAAVTALQVGEGLLLEIGFPPVVQVETAEHDEFVGNGRIQIRQPLELVPTGIGIDAGGFNVVRLHHLHPFTNRGLVLCIGMGMRIDDRELRLGGMMFFQHEHGDGIIVGQSQARPFGRSALRSAGETEDRGDRQYRQTESAHGKA